MSVKPGSHLCDKHNTSDISINISTRKKEHVAYAYAYVALCYAYRTSGNQALEAIGKEEAKKKL